MDGPAANPDPRSCTCHPDDNPPVPCQRKFALSECRAALRFQQLCSIASIEVDWLQQLVTGDDAMKQISAILTGKSR